MKITFRNVALAVALLAAVLVVLGNRFLGGGDTATIAEPVTTSSSAAASTAATAAGTGPASPSPSSSTVLPSMSVAPRHDDGDDGGDDPPIIASPADRPDVSEAAAAFAAAWLNTTGRSAAVWRAGLADRVTGDLAEDLSYADPQSVPAGGAVGSPVKVTAEGSLFNAAVPVVEAVPNGKAIGTLILTLLSNRGDWKVSEIDWKASR
jgi:hypothetical protein